LFLIVIILLTVLGGCADGQSGEQISETRLLLDTYCTITIHGDVSKELINEAFELLAEYEALFSKTIEGSDVWRINHARGEPVRVDIRTAAVILAGLAFGEFSDGMFDITIGRLSHLWNFGAEAGVPSEAEIEEARLTVNFRNVLIDGTTVQLTDPNAWIDLGAIAKGYIASRIAIFLEENGVNGALVDLGGDVAAYGNRRDGNPWRIAIRKPFGKIDDYLGVVEISNTTIASSGIYERHFEKDGVLYHHILDPFTGMPAKSDVTSATVIADGAMTGEALSTLFLLMDRNSVKQLIDRTYGDIGVVLVLENGEIELLGDVRLIN
jgi:thiamine biosynthesis lipoprotein